MLSLLRYLILGALAIGVVRMLLKALRLSGTGTRRPPTGRDASREVHNASFDVDDVQDAKFRDVP